MRTTTGSQTIQEMFKIKLKQDSLSAVSLCDWLSEQKNASYFFQDFLF